MCGVELKVGATYLIGANVLNNQIALSLCRSFVEQANDVNLDQLLAECKQQTEREDEETVDFGNVRRLSNPNYLKFDDRL